MVAFNIHLIPIILIFFSSQWAQPLPTNPEPAIIFDDYTYKTIRLENGLISHVLKTMEVTLR